MSEIFELISKQVTENKVVLYIKGTPDFPQCGFSYRVVEILGDLNIEYFAVDVLADDLVRQGIKEYGNWPTIPQLYVNGNLVGGCDIITSLYESGELKKLFDN